jgi:hypothetical protein
MRSSRVNRPLAHPINRLNSRLRFETLEARDVPATFVVSTLADSGAGSLREALLQANSTLGADRINFAVAGSIELASALPAITDRVDIDGSSAPGYTSTPLVQVDSAGVAGITFETGSEGSALRSLGFVNASTAGVTLGADQILLVGNYIGLELDGSTPAGNVGGLQINSSYNTIGIVGQPRNVISGNDGNGVTIDGAAGTDGAANTLVENFIGTDSTGLLDRGNTNFGVYLTNGALFNNIGGTANKPKDSIALTPGNLISGNDGDGVRIDGDADPATHSDNNFLGSNFIGTDITGKAALPNSGNGVSVVQADYNNIEGTEFGIDPFQLPFRYKNVISGNLGNGLWLHNAVGTNVFANFIGLGADNDTAVGNKLNGVLIDGTSRDTVFGGVIPLGNVVAGNFQNGVVIADQAAGTLVFNCFAGTAAFNDSAVVGNALNGILVTSTGGNNQFRTNVASGNGGNGIEISGDATGVIIDKAIIGMNTDGMIAQPNLGNGIQISGNAHGNTIGGFDESVIPQSATSGNGGYGIAILGNANNNTVSNTFIGTDVGGKAPIPNTLGGVFIGGTANNNTIGGTGTDPSDRNVISGNSGPGVTIDAATQNSITGNLIGLLADGVTAAGNQGDGVLLTGGASENLIGDATTSAGNTIAFNSGNGVTVQSGSKNSILKNSIHDNSDLGIELAAGANNDQAAPTLTNAVLISGALRVQGSITGAANSTYTVEVFGNATADASGDGEGEFYLGSALVTTDAAGAATFTFVASTIPNTATVFSATATDPVGNTSEFSNNVALSPAINPAVVVGAGSGGSPTAAAFDKTGDLLLSADVFASSFTGGVRVATGDVNGDGIPDVAVGTGPGTSTLVLILDGATGKQLFSIQPFEPGFIGGVFVALGDINGDGKADLAISPDEGGGPRVRVFNGNGFGQLNDFFGIQDPNFRGGARLAFGDVDGDGKADLLVAAGIGGGPRVAIFKGASVASGAASPVKVVNDFFVFEQTLRNGVFIASGDLNGDTFADIIVGGGPGGGSRVFAIDGQSLVSTGVQVQLANFIVGDADNRGGIRVAARDVDGDGLSEIITGAGDDDGSEVNIFSGENLPVNGLPDIVSTFDAFDDALSGGVFVG